MALQQLCKLTQPKVLGCYRREAHVVFMRRRQYGSVHRLTEGPEFRCQENFMRPILRPNGVVGIPPH